MPLAARNPNPQTQMDLFSLETPLPSPQIIQGGMDPDWESLSVEELRSLAWLPKGGLPNDENKARRIQLWLRSNQEVHRRIRKHEALEFQKKGTAQAWFSRWTPSNPALQKLSDGLENALDVVEALYPSIKARGMHQAEDMGIVMAHRNGKAEGILAKMAPYDQSCVHLEIHTVTGPWNHDPTTNSVEFEPGAKSHVFHLVYTELPTPGRLEADLCTYPLIRLEQNRLESPSGKSIIYQSEGLIHQNNKHGIHAHRPWDTLTTQEQENLKTLLQDT
jgi:hypothetical protein